MTRVLALANLQQFQAVKLQFDAGSIGGPKVIPQAAEITLHWQLASGKRGHNVLVGRYAGGYAGTAAQANSILTGLSSGGQWTALAAFIANTAALVSVTIRDLNQPNQPIITNTSPGAGGTSASVEMPNEIAAVITTRSAFTGPANRGRLYIPGWATNALGAGNIISPAAVTALTNWATTIAGVLSNQGYTWAIGHQARQAYTGSAGTEHPARVAGTVPITSVEVRDNHWDSQRRRGLR
jgi:hypothetical protein